MSDGAAKTDEIIFVDVGEDLPPGLTERFREVRGRTVRRYSIQDLLSPKAAKSRLRVVMHFGSVASFRRVPASVLRRHRSVALVSSSSEQQVRKSGIFEADDIAVATSEGAVEFLVERVEMDDVDVTIDEAPPNLATIDPLDSTQLNDWLTRQEAAGHRRVLDEDRRLRGLDVIDESGELLKKALPTDMRDESETDVAT